MVWLTAKEHDISERLVIRMRSGLKEYFNDLRHVERIILTKVERHSYSSIFYYIVTTRMGIAKRIVVKICRNAAQQYSRMVELWPRFAPYSGLQIPRPLDLFEEEMALVMEEAMGGPLSKNLARIGWSNTRLRTAESDCRRVAHWLRVYHQFDAVQANSAFNVDAALSGFDATLSGLQEIGCNISAFAESYPSISALAKRIAEESRPVSKLHGDFKIDNVMITRDCVTVLDISGDSRQITDFDIVAFLNSVLMLRLTRPIPWAAIDGMRKNFLEGYFGGLTTSELLIYFLQVLSLAEIALEIAQRRSSHIVNLWIGWSLKSLVAKLIKDVKRHL